MLKNIDIASDSPAHSHDQAGQLDRSGWIIRRKRILDSREARDIVAQAHARADVVLQEAHTQAQEAREVGFRQGLEMGVQAAMAPLLSILSHVQAIKEALRTEAIRCAQSSMEEFLARAPALAALLDAVMESHLSQTPSPVWLSVPATTDVAALEAHCKEVGIDARIETAQKGVLFSATWAGHIWEVCADNLYGPLRMGTAGLAAPLSEEEARVLCRDVLVKQVDRILP